MKTKKALPLAMYLVMICAYLIVMGILTFNPSAVPVETGNKNTNQLLTQPQKDGWRGEVSNNRGVLLVHQNGLISL